MAATLEGFLALLDQLDPTADSYDLAYLGELSGNAHAGAIQALLRRVQANADPRAMMTLARAGVEVATPMLQAHRRHPDPWVRFSVQRALALLGDATAAKALTAIAATGGGFLERFGAAMDLGDSSEPSAVAALLAALRDPEPLVRGRAMDSLVEHFSLDDLTRDGEGRVLLETPLKILGSLLMSEVPTIWERAAWEARRLFTELLAGRTPDSLGLRYERSEEEGYRARVRDAFFDDETPFDAGIVASARGHDRQWAEAFLALQLDPDIRSVRAVQAIAAVGARWLASALRESAAGLASDHEYALAVAEALRHLEG